jgi:signal transduction histidine kinase
LCFDSDIRQVLNNLIANSIDAMRQGGRLVLCTRDATDWKTGRSGVRITIADTGHGMSEEVRHRVFEAFYTTKEVNGTGLGLWISHGIVSRHHGFLTLRSNDKPGWNGTVFSLFLPDGKNASQPTQ